MKTFKECADSYKIYGGEHRYLDKIVEYFDGKLVTEIFPFDIKQMANDLFPSHSPATKNRQAITPARAVINHAYDRGWCNMIRIRNFKVVKEKDKRKPANVLWLFSFINQCEKDNLDHLAALVLFMNHTAARVSEAISLEWDDIDFGNRTANLRKTKTSVNSKRVLTDELIKRIINLNKTNKNVFSYSSRYGVNDRIRAVCKRAGIPYKSSHLVGRHSFATNAISLGIDVKTAMEAGGWKCSSVFIDTYVHMDDAGFQVAEKFNKMKLTI